MFHGKCAYCETYIRAVTTIEVEHWRPKGNVKSEEGPMYEGYAWLAADWANLFAACSNCNRPTKHAVPGGGVIAGKGMRFPLETGRTRGPIEGDEGTERPLLLNPCDPDPERAPERHLAFATPDELTDSDLQGIIRAPAAAGGDDPLGAMSISVYALNRDGLVTKRKDTYHRVARPILKIRETLARIRSVAPGSAEESYLLEEIKDNREELRYLLRDEAEHLLMVRQYAAPILAELDAWEAGAAGGSG